MLYLFASFIITTFSVIVFTIFALSKKHSSDEGAFSEYDIEEME